MLILQETFFGTRTGKLEEETTTIRYRKHLNINVTGILQYFTWGGLAHAKKNLQSYRREISSMSGMRKYLERHASMWDSFFRTVLTFGLLLEYRSTTLHNDLSFLA